MSKLTPETLSTILFATADFHNHCEMEKLWKRAPKSDYLIYYFFQTMSAQYLNVVPTSKRRKTMVWACYFTALLKVSWFQNVLLVALCGPKYQRKNLTNSDLLWDKILKFETESQEFAKSCWLNCWNFRVSTLAWLPWNWSFSYYEKNDEI